MTLADTILDIHRRAPLLCKYCVGTGRIWTTTSCDPSEKAALYECHQCNGTGLTPEPECEGEEE